MDSHGNVLKMFSYQNIEYPFFKRERLLELFLLSLFSKLLFLSFFIFSMLRLFIEDELGDF
jgi:hypothetical protein